MSKIKAGIVGAIIVAGLATVAIEARANRELRVEYRGLQSAGDDLGRLQTENQRLNGALKKIGGKNPEADELVRLNGRMSQLKGRPEGVVDAAFKPIADVGRATPQDAYVTFCSAMNAGDIDGVARLITFRDDSKESRDAFMAGFSDVVRTKYRTPERLLAAALFGVQEGVAWPDPAVSCQVLQTYEDHEPGVMRVRLWIHQAGGRESEVRDTFIRTADGWALIFRPLTDPGHAAVVRERIDPVTGLVKPLKK